MFTGLVETRSKLLSRTPLKDNSGEKMTFSHAWGPLTLGESIAISGACLTVIAFEDSQFEVELSPETLRLTTLGDLKVGEAVNLERALQTGDRLGGHLVTGHVDGVGVVKGMEPTGDMTQVSIEVPTELSQYVAKKGSITIDGVSLTVNDVSGCTAELLLIPHTQEITTLDELAIDKRVNIEVDLVARYVERLLEVRGSTE